MEPLLSATNERAVDIIDKGHSKEVGLLLLTTRDIGNIENSFYWKFGRISGFWKIISIVSTYLVWLQVDIQSSVDNLNRRYDNLVRLSARRKAQLTGTYISRKAMELPIVFGK